MAGKEMTFCTIFVNRYLGNAAVDPQSRPTVKKGRPSSRRLSRGIASPLTLVWLRKIDAHMHTLFISYLEMVFHAMS